MPSSLPLDSVTSQTLKNRIPHGYLERKKAKPNLRLVYPSCAAHPHGPDSKLSGPSLAVLKGCREMGIIAHLWGLKDKKSRKSERDRKSDGKVTGKQRIGAEIRGLVGCSCASILEVYDEAEGGGGHLTCRVSSAGEVASVTIGHARLEDRDTKNPSVSFWLAINPKAFFCGLHPCSSCKASGKSTPPHPESRAKSKCAPVPVSWRTSGQR